jgi:hypothetical protein
MPRRPGDVGRYCLIGIYSLSLLSDFARKTMIKASPYSDRANSELAVSDSSIGKASFAKPE